MTMLKSLLSSLIIHLVCFQLIFMGSIQEIRHSKRVPASFDHTYTLEDLKKQLNDFHVDVKGKELEPDCGEDSKEESDEELSEEELAMQALFGGQSTIYSREDRAFYKYVDSLKMNSCGGGKSVKAPQKPECKIEKVDGFIDRKIKEIMALEAKEKEIPEFKLDDPKVRSLHKKAMELLQEVRMYLSDTSVEREKRVELLVDYLGKIALPMRDLITVMRAYTPLEYDGVYFYESLLPQINSELIGNDELTKDLILSGPNKMVENFHLEIEEKRWGRLDLRYNPNEVLARDIVQIMKAPTKRNYVRSMKWMTLQMMITQIHSYEAMLGEEKPIEIPRACQNHFNGSLPEKMEIQYTTEQGSRSIDTILANHGLIMSQGNSQYTEWYMDNISKDPLLEGYSGLMPFEAYKAAMQGLEKTEDKRILPDLDDYTDFEKTVNLLRGKALSEFYDDNSYVFGLIDFEDESFYGAELFQKLLTRPETSEIYEFENEEGEALEIDHVGQNLSTFMTELMQRHKVRYWDDLLTDRLKSRLKRNFVRIRFPSLYGATVWRMWALKELEEWANQYNDGDVPVKTMSSINRAFRHSNHRLAHGKNVKEHLENIKAYLKELKVADDFTPTRRLTTGDHVEGYKLLSKLWNDLSRYTDDLEISRTNELDFIKGQFETGNPWARVRLSYLILMEELRSIRSGDLPSYSRASMTEFNGETINSCKKRDVHSIRQKLASAAQKMGIHQTLEPGYASKLTNEDEKMALWEGVIDEASPLFKQKDQKGKPYYKKLEQTTYQTFLGRDQVQKFVEEFIPEGLRKEEMLEIDEYLRSSEGDLGNFFGSLYRLRGNPEEQMAYFEEFSQDNGIDNAYNAKVGFLLFDNSLKRHVLRSIIKGAANLRKNAIKAKLESFCNLEPNDHESFKTLYYSTSKAQNKLNGLLGAPTVPDEVLEGIQDKLTSMSDDEWTDMKLGIGAALLGVGAMIIGGACIGVTGGLCAPLGVAMMAAGASAMTMQVALVSREFNRKIDADENEASVLEMEKLGFANKGSSENVSRTWFWTAFEAISIIPLVGVTARSVRVGSKLTVVSAGMLARNTGKHGFRNAWRMSGQAGKTVVSEADTRFARLVLGFDSVANQSKEFLGSLSKMGGEVSEALKNLGKAGLDRKIVARAFERIKGLRQLHASGQLSAYALAKRIGQIIQGLKSAAARQATKGATYTSKVVVEETPQMIDKMTAKTVSEYFAGNPKGLHYLMKTYAKKLPKAHKAMARYEKGTSTLGKVTLLPWIKNGIRSLRSSQLVKNADKITRLEKELAELVAKNGDLEKFVLKNVDDLTDVFIKIPVRKREIPYMFFIQGGPHLGKSLSSIPGKTAQALLHRASNGLVMRKFFNARSRLIYESMKSQARTLLGLKKYVASETALESFRAFQQAVGHTTEKLSGEAQQSVVRQYSKLEDELAKKILSHVKNQIDADTAFSRLKKNLYKGNHRLRQEFTELDDATLKRVIFSPETEHEKAIGTVIWSSLPLEDLFSLREVGEVAHRVIRELAQYENVDEFQALLNAFKVLVIKRDPGVVEIM